MTDWNLSDKIKDFNTDPNSQSQILSISIEDVKEFIRRLKDIQIDSFTDGIEDNYDWLRGVSFALNVVKRKIDELAGERLK